jgi:predicted amidohydrolase YtcJ
VKTVGIAPLDVLRWATKNGGELMGLPVGTIEEGKLADLAVLNNDYFRVKDEDIKKLRSVLTVVDGQVVHDAGVLKSDGHGRHG